MPGLGPAAARAAVDRRIGPGLVTAQQRHLLPGGLPFGTEALTGARRIHLTVGRLGERHGAHGDELKRIHVAPQRGQLSVPGAAGDGTGMPLRE
ncbi:MAG: hypothetical protein M3Q47_13635 [Actinomycetota bacterium]|nr:hypothetical protein [Actinomycetota bacterium]